MVRGRHGEAHAAYRSMWDEPQRALLPSRSQAIISIGLGEAALGAGDAEAAREAYRRVAEIAEVLADRELAAAARLGLERAGSAMEASGEPA